MRLVILSSEFPPGPGGIGTHAYQLATYLQHLNWEVSVVTPQDYADEQEIREFNCAQAFPIVRLRSNGATAAKAILRRETARRWIKQWKPDVLIASGQRSAWIAPTLCSKRLPLIIVGHGFEFGILGGWNNKLTRWAFQRAALVVCVSEYTRRKMLAAGIRPRIVQVITNGADQIQFEVLPPDQVLVTRKSLKLENARLLITVGNVTERKGQEVVIRALPEILAHVPNTHYLIAGLPTRKRELVEVAEKLRVADHVHFLGRVENGYLVSLLNCADVFVMTSRFTRDGDSEGFGIAVVEAALCGKPAIVSGESGLSEAVVDGVTGIVVRANDEEATAKAVVRLLTDGARRNEMGSAARKRALATQTWEHAARQYDTALRRVLPPFLLKNGSETKRALSIQ